MSMPSWLLRAHRFSRLPRLIQLPLGVEITLLLVIKISLLTVLAKTFFSAPQAKHMHMPTALVEQHLLSAAAPFPESLPPSAAATASGASDTAAPSVPPFVLPSSSPQASSPNNIEVIHASH